MHYYFHTDVQSIRDYMQNTSHLVCDKSCFYSQRDMGRHSHCHTCQDFYTLNKKLKFKNE